MTAKISLEETLTNWEKALREAQTACEANDWVAFRQLTYACHAQFDRLRALAAAHLAAGDVEFVARYRQRVQDDAASLERLIASLRTWQVDIQNRMQGRRRARQTAKSYHPSAPASPRHFRLYARGSSAPGQPTAD